MPDSRRGDRPPPPEVNGYAETDPTGRYGRFDEVLGKGAMKTVYRAFDELNGMEVAWNQAKLCDVLSSPEALQRMYSEVDLLSALDHGSIIRFFTSWIDVHTRTFNFITEMFTSGTLREYRQRYRRVDIRAVKNWARQILRGLIFLHGHDPPVIHRDLKCDNIFVNGHLGQVKIGDLGLAAVLRGSQNAHSVIGTPEFMAPELYEEDYNELVDIYSFGMCVLEMLTSEYPYSECSNPAQIYKKVISGKLPDAFHRIQDTEAKRFIGRCLETASSRSSARELLLDPFLLSSERSSNNNTVPVKANKIAGREGHGHLHMPAHTDMTITGKMNHEDDTIFLKVQIADKDGHARNIYFPFDIASDTPIDVANEMVKELEITDREPAEIAKVIGQEISFLVPGWNGAPPEQQQQHLPQVYNYNDDDDDGGSLSHPFFYMSSPPSSHMSDAGPSGSSSGAYQGDWLQEGLFSDDDDTSSMHSGKYAAVSFQSGDEQEVPSAPKKPTRFGGDAAEEELAARFREQCEVAAAAESWSGGKKGGGGKKKLMRNKSTGDMRSQLLNRTLVDGIKRRLLKTVGAVEHVGFRTPCKDGGRRSAAAASPEKGEKKKKGAVWRKG